MALKQAGGVSPGTFRVYTPLNAVTATTTSNEIPISGAKKVTLALTRANHGSGSSAFKVQVSVDGSTYVDYNGLMEDLTNTNAQDVTRVTTITLSANGTTMARLDLSSMGFLGMKVVVTETTDGTHTAKALVEF